ncbi:unnamed protein product [Microthlaspi erraticum]|uniref:Uncharacterized protein n=1 Tax=Microthlaspi erraticum TaxID=1685480 RepID=A0A6D2JTJ9_9BRAS|nr:unnamed protein product [Microthlaspi erraticum]
MDFIKTSSPRALSELTLQRNWIGIIWMSISEVMIKLVKTGQCIHFIRLDRADANEGKLAAARHNHVPRPTHPSDQEGFVPRPAKIHRPNHPSVRPRRPNTKTLGHDRSDRADSRLRPDDRPTVPTDRPNGPIDPKPVLKPVSHVFTARLDLMPPLKT